MSEIKLLSCPICGGEAELIEQKHREYPSTYIVACKGRCVCQYPYRNEERAISAWNTRKPIEDMVEQLEKASDYYECDEQGREHVQMVDLSEAIDIVRGGRE